MDFFKAKSLIIFPRFYGKKLFFELGNPFKCSKKVGREFGSRELCGRWLDGFRVEGIGRRDVGGGGEVGKREAWAQSWREVGGSNSLL